jgi:hypothetical protein
VIRERIHLITIFNLLPSLSQDTIQDKGDKLCSYLSGDLQVSINTSTGTLEQLCNITTTGTIHTL